MGGRAARALRLLLLLVLALAAVEYLFGSMLDASPLRSYLRTPPNDTQALAADRNTEKSAVWPKKHQTELTKNPSSNLTEAKNNSTLVNLGNKMNNRTSNGTAANETRPEDSGEFSTPLFITKIMEGLKNLVTTESGLARRNDSELPLCDEMPPDLGPISVNKTEVDLDWVERRFPEVQQGGRYAPPNCTARHKVALIIPYRDRQQHLAIFLNHMHPFLMKQQLDYGIFIVEQEGSHEFNRAKLMNVGFTEAQRARAGGWQCFVFHDIDLLPLDGRNLYSCPRQPRHMSASIDKLHFKLPYEDIFGGVSAMTRDQFTAVNGFSNKYWGWGGEDDDMFYRLKKMNYHVARYKMSIARYAMLDHKKSAPNPKRYQLLSQTSKTFQQDGLSTLRYRLAALTARPLHTHLLADISETS